MFHVDSTRLAIAASLLLVFPMAGCNRKPLPKTGSMGLAQSRSQGRDFIQIDAANSGTITGTAHYNPLFAVSRADGHFTTKGLPPGTCTLAAVQEKLGTKSQSVTVQKQWTTVADFTFTE